ncbi:MAG: hypothetical protein EXR72_10580 [Myxococcales bacterium]|nr:hypothetical protein [Myxococcales bacterium]
MPISIAPGRGWSRAPSWPLSPSTPITSPVVFRTPRARSSAGAAMRDFPFRARLRAALSVAALAGCAPTFYERTVAEPGAVRIATGVIRSVSEGQGPIPRPDERVKVAWEGRFVDGKVFGSSQATGVLEVTPASASPCWRDALARMRVGGKAKLLCLPDTAHADEAFKVPADTTVTFDLELVAPGSPEALPPLPTGVVLRTIIQGTGERPRSTDKVKVHYEGRLADRTVFDSSIKRGEPAVLPLGDVIPCWRLGLQRMRVGEKVELTCPPEVAYGKKGSPPKVPPDATLTFEIELLGIEK